MTPPRDGEAADPVLAIVAVGPAAANAWRVLLVRPETPASAEERIVPSGGLQITLGDIELTIRVA